MASKGAMTRLQRACSSVEGDVSQAELTTLLRDLRAGVYTARDLNERAFESDPFSKRPLPGTILTAAADHLPVQHIKAMLDAGADPNLAVRAGARAPSDGYGTDYPLAVAVSGGRSDVVALLLERGARASQKLPSGQYPIHCACDASVGLDVLAMLLDAGADPSATTEVGENVLLLIRRQEAQGAVVWADGARRLIQNALALRKTRRGPLLLKVVPTARPLRPGRDFGLHMRRGDDGATGAVVQAIRGGVDVLGEAIAATMSAVRWEKDVGHRSVLGGSDMMFVLALRGAEWTIALRPVGQPVRALPTLREQAKRILLRAKASGIAIVLDSMMSTLALDSRKLRSRRSSPRLAWEPVQHEALVRERLFVPPAQLKVSGRNVTLVLRRVRPVDVVRVDLVVIAEW